MDHTKFTLDFKFCIGWKLLKFLAERDSSKQAQKIILKNSKWFDANIDPINSLNYLMKMNLLYYFYS